MQGTTAPAVYHGPRKLLANARPVWTLIAEEAKEQHLDGALARSRTRNSASARSMGLRSSHHADELDLLSVRHILRGIRHFLESAVERKTGDKMQWIGSNCGCGDQMAVTRQFKARDQCEYFEMRMPSGVQAESAWRHRARGAARTAVSYFRAKRYADMTKDAELVHFQQIINAYGSKAVFHWLNQPSDATRVVTIHELDYEQRQSLDKNAAYNNADALIVHFEALRDQLVGLLRAAGQSPRRAAWHGHPEALA